MKINDDDDGCGDAEVLVFITSMQSDPTGRATIAAEIRKRLAMSQTDLARQAKVAQGTVSNFLRGQPIRTDYAERILLALAGEIAVRGTGGRFSKAQVSAMQSQISQEIEIISGRSEPIGPRALPGGAIPLDAANFVRREREIAKFIDNGVKAPAVTMRVEGPPHCGKSTLLLQVAHEAKKAKFIVTTFDLSSMPLDHAGEGTEKSFSVLAARLAQSWGVVPPSDVEDYASLQLFIREEREKHVELQALIIVDDVHRFRKPVREGLFDVCRNLHNERNELKLSWLLAVEPSSPEIGNWLEESRGYFSPTEPRLKWFKQDEVEQMLGKYPEYDFSLASRLIAKFNGQPFLTHVAIDLLLGGESVEEVEQMALQRDGKFGKHLGALEKAMGSDLLSILRSSKQLPLDEISHDQKHLLVDTSVATETSTGLMWASEFYSQTIPNKVD